MEGKIRYLFESYLTSVKTNRPIRLERVCSHIWEVSLQISETYQDLGQHINGLDRGRAEEGVCAGGGGFSPLLTSPPPHRKSAITACLPC